LKLSAVSVFFGSVIAAAFPSNVSHEATVPAGIKLDVAKPATVPAFVSLVSFPVFVLAAEDSATTSPGARLAAEVLSAKFAGTAATAEAQMVRPEPLSPNAVVVPVDPKTPLRTAALSQNQADEAADKQDDDQEAVVKSHRQAKAKPATKRRHTARARHKSGARRTASATSGGIGASISKIVGFVGMPPDQMLTP
jgi:hypothetical protein